MDDAGVQAAIDAVIDADILAQKSLVADRRFLHLLGLLYGAWTAQDLTIDFGIGRFLKIPHDQALLLTAGMQFGHKIRILKDLIRKTKDPNKDKMIGALNKLQNESKRNVFAHSYLIGNPTSVSFVERSAGGDFKIRQHTYTLPEWQDHLTAFTNAGKALWEGLGEPQAELEEFMDAALKAAKS
jgi:hypothetical protein